MGVLRPRVGRGSWLGSLRRDNCHWVVVNTLEKACMHWNVCLVFVLKQALEACFVLYACMHWGDQSCYSGLCVNF